MSDSRDIEFIYDIWYSKNGQILRVILLFHISLVYDFILYQCDKYRFCHGLEYYFVANLGVIVEKLVKLIAEKLRKK